MAAEVETAKSDPDSLKLAKASMMECMNYMSELESRFVSVAWSPGNVPYFVMGCYNCLRFIHGISGEEAAPKISTNEPVLGVWWQQDCGSEGSLSSKVVVLTKAKVSIFCVTRKDGYHSAKFEVAEDFRVGDNRHETANLSSFEHQGSSLSPCGTRLLITSEYKGSFRVCRGDIRVLQVRKTKQLGNPMERVGGENGGSSPAGDRVSISGDDDALWCDLKESFSGDDDSFSLVRTTLQRNNSHNPLMSTSNSLQAKKSLTLCRSFSDGSRSRSPTDSAASPSEERDRVDSPTREPNQAEQLEDGIPRVVVWSPKGEHFLVGCNRTGDKHTLPRLLVYKYNQKLGVGESAQSDEGKKSWFVMHEEVPKVCGTVHRLLKDNREYFKRQIPGWRDAETPSGLRCAMWSPNGTQFAFCWRGPNVDACSMRIVDLKSGCCSLTFHTCTAAGIPKKIWSNCKPEHWVSLQAKFGIVGMDWCPNGLQFLVRTSEQVFVVDAVNGFVVKAISVPEVASMDQVKLEAIRKDWEQWEATPQESTAEKLVKTHTELLSLLSAVLAGSPKQVEGDAISGAFHSRSTTFSSCGGLICATCCDGTVRVLNIVHGVTQQLVTHVEKIDETGTRKFTELRRLDSSIVRREESTKGRLEKSRTAAAATAMKRRRRETVTIKRQASGYNQLGGNIPAKETYASENINYNKLGTYCFDLSPDGNRVATINSERNDCSILEVGNLSRRVNLPNDGPNESTMVKWGPDSRTLALVNTIIGDKEKGDHTRSKSARRKSRDFRDVVDQRTNSKRIMRVEVLKLGADYDENAELLRSDIEVEHEVLEETIFSSDTSSTNLRTALWWHSSTQLLALHDRSFHSANRSPGTRSSSLSERIEDRTYEASVGKYALEHASVPTSALNVLLGVKVRALLLWPHATFLHLMWPHQSTLSLTYTVSPPASLYPAAAGVYSRATPQT
jgi:hypothetical protein